MNRRWNGVGITPTSLQVTSREEKDSSPPWSTILPCLWVRSSGGHVGILFRFLTGVISISPSCRFLCGDFERSCRACRPISCYRWKELEKKYKLEHRC